MDTRKEKLLNLLNEIDENNEFWDKLENIFNDKKQDKEDKIVNKSFINPDDKYLLPRPWDMPFTLPGGGAIPAQNITGHAPLTGCPGHIGIVIYTNYNQKTAISVNFNTFKNAREIINIVSRALVEGKNVDWDNLYPFNTNLRGQGGYVCDTRPSWESF